MHVYKVLGTCYICATLDENVRIILMSCLYPTILIFLTKSVCMHALTVRIMYHTARKYKDRLVLMLIFIRSLYLRPYYAIIILVVSPVASFVEEATTIADRSSVVDGPVLSGAPRCVPHLAFGGLLDGEPTKNSLVVSCEQIKKKLALMVVIIVTSRSRSFLVTAVAIDCLLAASHPTSPPYTPQLFLVCPGKVSSALGTFPTSAFLSQTIHQ